MQIITNTLQLTDEAVRVYPTGYLQKIVADESGALLTKAILDPKLDPLSYIRLKARQSFDRHSLVHTIEVALIVAETGADLDAYFEGGPLDGEIKQVPPSYGNSYAVPVFDERASYLERNPGPSTTMDYRTEVYERTRPHEFKHKPQGPIHAGHLKQQEALDRQQRAIEAGNE